MEIDDAILADLVRQFPELYDKSNKNFKDRNVRENAWETIAGTLNVDIKTAVGRWNVLRTRYGVERRKEKLMPSGSGAKKPWALYSDLSFLEKHITMRKTIGNITSAPTEKSQPSTSSSPWSSMNIIMEDDSMCESEDIMNESIEISCESNPMLEETGTAEKENSPHNEIPQQRSITLEKNSTPPLTKKRKRNEEVNVMSKLSLAFDNFNQFIKAKDKQETGPNLEHESIINFMKFVGNDLMQIRNKKIRYSAEMEIMRITKNALAEDMSDDS